MAAIRQYIRLALRSSASALFSILPNRALFMIFPPLDVSDNQYMSGISLDVTLVTTRGEKEGGQRIAHHGLYSKRKPKKIKPEPQKILIELVLKIGQDAQQPSEEFVGQIYCCLRSTLRFVCLSIVGRLVSA
jgi:hypothetical protein